jgi:hypothetical protein
MKPSTWPSLNGSLVWEVRAVVGGFWMKTNNFGGYYFPINYNFS